MLSGIKPSKKLIYLDHAAATPLDARVKKAMEPFWAAHFGNPSSLYKEGMAAKAAIDGARKNIARVLNARPEEIIFTAGGTESVNLALLGAARSAPKTKGSRPHIISTQIEHHAVLNSLDVLKEEGFDVTLVGVDSDGFIKIEELKKAVRPETILISVMYANNEIGSIQPIAEIGKWLVKINAGRMQNELPRILLHTDACQAAGSLDTNIHRLGVDLLSANGSKIYGPKQTGFLFVRTGTNLKPLIYGGGQERNLRSGTENVPGIVGLAEALITAQKSATKENKRLSALQKYLVSKLLKIRDITLNGPQPDLKQRLANNINITINKVESEALMLYLDSYNVAVSTGSACTTGLADPSHVLLAIGRTPAQAKSSIRLTMGKETDKRQVDYVIKILNELIPELRRINNF